MVGPERESGVPNLCTRRLLPFRLRAVTREIAQGIHWIQELGPSRVGIGDSLHRRGASWYEEGREIFIPQNAFLIEGKKSLLFDTLSPAAGDMIIQAVESVLGDRPLDYLVVSHPDVPHAGNTGRILRRYQEATLVAPKYGDTHELYHLEDSLKVGVGDYLDLGGPIIQFHEATFLDAALSVWMSEERSGTLFTVDWLGFPLLDGERLSFMDEVVGPDPAEEDLVDRLHEFHGRVMHWLQYVDVPKVQAETDLLLMRQHPMIIAPAHGPVIRREPQRFFQLMKDTVARVRETGRVGVL